MVGANDIFCQKNAASRFKRVDSRCTVIMGIRLNQVPYTILWQVNNSQHPTNYLEANYIKANLSASLTVLDPAGKISHKSCLINDQAPKFKSSVKVENCNINNYIRGQLEINKNCSWPYGWKEMFRFRETRISVIRILEKKRKKKEKSVIKI